MIQQFCTQCGTKLPEQSNFCPECGVSIERQIEPPASQVRATQPQRAKERDSSRTILLSLSGALVIVLIGALVYLAVVRPNRVTDSLNRLPGDRAANIDALPDIHDEEGMPYPEVPRVSVPEAKARYDAGTALFVDVRDGESYVAAHIPNAISLPLTELGARYQELPMNSEILTYCA